ncbi:MAG TPA: helix-turn-helix transcriptional regulator [Ignavibacteriaceae bacterium]|nr:helix-turn-helix transcriptional regulator [Ignavibacteriaceae bacterium]
MPKDTLGDRIAQIRNNLDYNQKEFAEALGLKSAAAISKWESNDREPSIEMIMKIATIGGRSIEWLMSGSERNNSYSERMELLEEENKKLKKELMAYEKAIAYLNKIKEKE